MPVPDSRPLVLRRADTIPRVARDERQRGVEGLRASDLALAPQLDDVAVHERDVVREARAVQLRGRYRRPSAEADLV